MPAEIALLEHNGAHEVRGVEESTPHIRAERSGRPHGKERDRRRRGGERAPVPARGERQRNHQSELRFVGEQSEQKAGHDRAPIQHGQRAAEQRCRKEAILAMTEIDQHGREGDGKKELCPRF